MSSTIFVIFLCPIRLDMWERLDIRLVNGMYSRGRMSATDIVKQCRAAMKAANYDPIVDLRIGYIESNHKRKES